MRAAILAGLIGFFSFARMGGGAPTDVAMSEVLRDLSSVLRPVA